MVPNKHLWKMNPVRSAAISLTWCVPSPMNLTPVLNNRSPRSGVTTRRPRAVYHRTSLVTSSSAENSTDGNDATQIPPPPPAASTRPLSYQEFSLPADYQLKISATTFSLLTDSVLETKWQNEENRKASGAYTDDAEMGTDDCCVAPPDSGTNLMFGTSGIADDDLSASDPYKAFARFTRIAAPTATWGEATEDLSTKPTLLESTLSDGAAATPYSTASIVHRFLWYTRARQNLRDFVTFFCGDFDNADQIANERAHNIFPGEGGGHEHIHCVIAPVGNDILFARYYFNGDPTKVFRTRVYSVSPGNSGRTGIVEMRILRLYEEAEQRLRESGYDLSCISWEDEDGERTDMYEWMRGCEVFWERYTPVNGENDEATQALGISGGDRFIGFMKGGGCEVFSKIIGQRLRVMDDLLLTSEDLWVADRGFDESGNFVYGNRRGIPYKMRRITEGSPHSWTLSATEEPPEGYIS